MHDTPYLPSNSFERIYLLHTCHGEREKARHVFLFCCSQTKLLYAFVVNPSTSQKKVEENPALLKNAFTSVMQELEQETQFIDWAVDQHWQFNELRTALVAIDKLISEYKAKTRVATLVLLQSPMAPEQLGNAGLKTMVESFPVIRVPVLKVDIKLPALAWVQFAFKNGVARLAEIGDWLQHRITLSRYALVPLGNLDEDSALSLIDNLFARNLSIHRHVLWYSHSSLPDLGGHENKDFRGFLHDEIENPELISKGFYRGYTVELSVQELAINTILQSEFLKEFEEATMAAQQLTAGSKSKQEKADAGENPSTTEFDTDLDEFVTCQHAFKRLKELVTSWFDDYLKDDPSAGYLLHNFQRWLQSPSAAKLYDPLLHRLVHKLMKKNFFQLLLRFKQLGCKVVYANFHRMLVYTDKKTFSEAESHINFVLSNLKTTQLFQYITLQPVEYYHILLFKDIYNFGGIKESQPDQISSRWDVCNHLPEVTQKKFLYLIGEFILKVSRYNKKALEKAQRREPGDAEQAAAEEMLGRAGDKKHKIESYMDAVEDIKKEADHDFISDLITKFMSPKIFDIVQDFLMKKSEEEQLDYSDNDEAEDDYQDLLEEYDEDDPNNLGAGDGNHHVEARKRRERERILKERKRWEFPQRIGSYQRYVMPALEFSKFITEHAFGLDEAFYQEAHNLKSNLLRMIRVKEFSEEVQKGVEPSLILVVPDVICKECQSCYDLDICRDPGLNALKEDTDGVQAGNWECKFCFLDLSKEMIESRLLDFVNKRLIAYQMQDLVCKQCKMVKNTIVSQNCDCTGVYLQTAGHMEPEKLRNPNLLNQMTDIKLFMQLIQNFANFHSMHLLKETSAQILTLFG